MAEVLPFQGLRYNPDKIKNISDVVTPPYDVISDQDRDIFYRRHPNSIIRLDKGKPAASDTDADNIHTRAAAYLADWRKHGILVQDQEPGFYLTALEFDAEGRKITRYGLTGRVKVEPFDRGAVLPHETTFSKVKTERLSLIKACRANFSPIFSIFSDETGLMETLKHDAASTTPVYDFIDDAGHRHQLWRITDPGRLREISAAFRGKTLFIADGHHRYETALNYKNWLMETGTPVSDDHPASYAMMYLCAMQDPGLVILPTHRLVASVPENRRNALIKTAARYFDMESFPFDPSDMAGAMQRFRQALIAGPREHKIGIFMKGHLEFTVLRLRPGMMDQAFGNGIPEPLKSLDVTILTRLILGKIMDFTDAMLDDETVISFTSREDKAIAAIAAGTHDMAFMLNPTAGSQVKEIAEKGLIMPRKSTYYFPKAISGLVIRALDAGANA